MARPDLTVRLAPRSFFKHYEHNAQEGTGTDQDCPEFGAAIAQFGFWIPILAKSDGTVVDGHFRLDTVDWMAEHMVEAFKRHELHQLPWLCADSMTDAQVRAFRLSVNRQAQRRKPDPDKLLAELERIAVEGVVPLGEEGPIGFALVDGDSAVEEDDGWALDERTADVAVITVHVRVPSSAEVRAALMEALSPFSVEKVEVSALKKRAPAAGA